MKKPEQDPIDIRFDTLHDWKKFPEQYKQLLRLAVILVQNAKHEIPAIKKAAKIHASQISECDRREAECTRRIAEANRCIQQQLTEIGLSNDATEQALKAAAALQLDEVFAKFEVKCKQEAEIIAVYEKYAACMQPSATPHNGLVPHLKFLVQNGNVKLCDLWTYLGLTVPQNLVKPEENTSYNFDNVGIDWGDDVDYTGEMDFACEVSVPNQNLDFNERILHCGDSRELIVDDLYELQAFLAVRRLEQQKHDKGIMLQAEALLPQLTLTEIDQCLASVKEAIALVEAKRTRHLLLVCDSNAYCERILVGIRQRQGVIAHCEAQLQEIQQQREELAQSYATTQPTLARMVAETKKAQREAQDILSRINDGREVYLVGDINNL
eukprot:TRINITY_DN3171_c0_g1_i1.p1 TRINITY_DN3171_c0_g1~~TRINITY_DN3171_c0_g1_i1.p1  ORF type:complete len:382 (-),score=79.87 TRINITY_DN3171_c0_g1_i1:1180-2325(-)